MHFDLLDLTELTDMSDQELAEVFADSDDDTSESPAGKHDRQGIHQTPLPTNPYAYDGKVFALLYYFIHHFCIFMEGLYLLL